MLTAQQLKQAQLDELYDWVDGLPLSRPKKNISRDFADGLLMAEIIHHFYPKIVQMHNYPSGNSYKIKLSNWQTLKNKVLNKLGLYLTQDDCSRLANASPGAIEAMLYEVKRVIDDAILLHGSDTSPQKINAQNITKREIENFSALEVKAVKQSYSGTKVQQLRQILNLIKQKISIVQKSVQRKDVQIRELEEILRESLGQ